MRPSDLNPLSFAGPHSIWFVRPKRMRNGDDGSDTHSGRPNSSRSIAELCVTPSLSMSIFLKVVTFTSISSAVYLQSRKTPVRQFIHTVSRLSNTSSRSPKFFCRQSLQCNNTKVLARVCVSQCKHRLQSSNNNSFPQYATERTHLQMVLQYSPRSCSHQIFTGSCLKY